MRANELVNFKDMLTDVMAYYGKDCSKFTLEVWWQALSSFDFEQVARALQKHATDPERGQFAPKVADMVRALQGTSTDRAAMAWGKVYEAMGSVGAYSDVVFDDPAIHAVIEDLGGWPKVCRTEIAELSYLQHRFQEAHRVYTSRGDFEFQRRLTGDRSPDHEYERYGRELPRPYLIGDREKAKEVLRLGNVAGKVQITSLSSNAMDLITSRATLQIENKK